VSCEHDACRQLARLTAQWAGRLSDDEDTLGDVVQEMRTWIRGSRNRLRMVALAASGTLKEFMIHRVGTQMGSLTAARGGSWLIRSLEGCNTNAVAATQAAIALANGDDSMARDVLIAHENVTGPPGLFGMATEGIHMSGHLLALDPDVDVDDWFQ